MDKVAAIRHAIVVEKRSRRSVAKAFKVGRKTIDRYVDGDAEPGLRKKVARPSPKTDVARAKLEELIAAVPTKESKKHRLTAQRAYDLLRGAKVDVGYTVVKALMAERRLAAKAVSVPLTFSPGEVAEVDFFEVVVVVDGVEQAAWLFVMRLMSSGRDFCRVYPRQDQVCFLDGHVRAFEYFGGVPERGIYDNLKAAAQKILVGSERKLSPRFRELTEHFLFEACFARPYHGNDKGGVEARGKHIRLQSMTPLLSGTTLDEVNALLMADVERRFFASTNAAERWSTEQAALREVTWGGFDPRRMRLEVPVSSSSTVTVEGAVYSVPTAWARRRVTTYAGVEDVEIRLGEQSVVRRRLARGQRDIAYAAHYLDELAKKPQAVRQVADTLVAQLGGAFPSFWKRLVDDDGPREASRKMARILRGVQELGRDECERRVAAALSMGEAVATALLVTPVSPTTTTMMVPAVLDVFVEASSVAVFDLLLSPGGVQ